MFITCVVTHSNHSREYIFVAYPNSDMHIASIGLHITHFYTNETNERTQQNQIVNDDDGKEDGKASISSYSQFHKWTVGITV